MKKEAITNKNIKPLCAVAVLMLFRYAMVSDVLSSGGGFVLRAVTSVAASVLVSALFLYTVYRQTGCFSDGYKYIAIMLIADPLILLNLFDVWQALSLTALLVYVSRLNKIQSVKALIANIALFTALTTVINPNGVFGYAAFILCSGLVYGAFSENKIIGNKNDVAAPVFVSVSSAVISAVAGGLVRKAFDYTPLYNTIIYERFDLQPIKSLFTTNRLFTELRIAVLACIPVAAACILFAGLLKKDKANGKNVDFTFRRKLVCASLCAIIISDVAGYLFFNSKASISLLILSPLILILIIKNSRNAEFTQTVAELENKIASHPVLFTAAVIYTAAFFIPFCGRNTIFAYITKLWV